MLFLSFGGRKDNLNSHIRRVHPELIRASIGQDPAADADLAEPKIVGDPEEDESEDGPLSREVDDIEAKCFYGATSEVNETQTGISKTVFSPSTAQQNVAVSLADGRQLC